jgi:hypothetical protein
LSNSVEFPAGLAALGNERQAIADERIQDSIIANTLIGVAGEEIGETSTWRSLWW